jgi:UDP-GlcNAc:undecaprenyl-phosphate GlcNAc-1-phosphate transferase
VSLDLGGTELSAWWLVGAFVGAALLSAMLVQLSIVVARRIGVVDGPDGGRKHQDHPIPRMGGLAVAAAFTVVLLVATWATGDVQSVALLAGVLLPALAVAALGFLDDLLALGPWLRLVGVGLLALVVWWTGTRVAVTNIEWLDLVITVVWIVGITNALNLLDNSDGLAASTVTVTSLGTAAIALMYGQYLVGALALALAGAAIGFLWHNWHPATVYLGDAGAYFLGFLLAVVALRLRPVSIDLQWSALIPILLLLLPIADTTFVVIRRLREGRHPFTPGRDHLSHVLMDRGLTVRQSVLALQGVLVISVLAAVALAWVLR